MIVSVIIPIHNKFAYLERSINSVLSQTYTNLEILLVDDASTDGSAEKLLQFSDPRIRILSRDIPGPGGYAARNFGIENATGEWIAFLDADDDWFPNHVERMMAVLKSFPDANLLSCGWKICRGTERRENTFYSEHKSKGLIVLRLAEYIKWAKKGRNPLWTSVCMVRATTATATLFPADSGARRGGDSFAWLKLISAGNPLYWSNHIGANYYVDIENQVTSNAKGEFNLFNKIQFLMISKNLDARDHKILKRYFNFKLIQNYLLACDSQDADKILRSNLFLRDDVIKGGLFTIFSYLPKGIRKAFRKLFFRLNNIL